MIFCKKCILPDTRPNLVIESDGICNACKNHSSRVLIDWNHREKEFIMLISKISKKNKSNYDCLIPVSGGKDSTWQVIKCLEFGMKPLALTWKTPARTPIGQKNLDNLVSLGVDHIDYQINPKVESRFMLDTFKKYGATAIPMHMALFNIPLKIAAKFDIPLIIYGENSAQEYGGKKETSKNYYLNKKWFDSHGVTHGTTAEDWISKKLSKKDMNAYLGVSWSELKRKKINAIFLGHFFKWDVINSYKIAMKNGFKNRKEGPKVGIYNYTDIDCEFISIHHWLKWYKFGFVRDMDNLSLEIRNERMTRNDALRYLINKGVKPPIKDINLFCKFVGIKIEEFNKISEKFRNKKIWKKVNGNWKLNKFIISNWKY